MSLCSFPVLKIKRFVSRALLRHASSLLKRSEYYFFLFFGQERVTRTLSSTATATIVVSYTAASRFSQEKMLEVHLFMKVLIQLIVCPQPGRERR